MSFSKPFILYRDTKDTDILYDDEKKDMMIEGMIYLYNYETQLNDIEIYLKDIDLYSLDYSCFSFIDKDGIRKACHANTGSIIHPIVLNRNKIHEVDIPIYYNFEKITSYLPFYNFVDFQYKDISSMISADLNSEKGTLPRYLFFSNNNTNFNKLKKKGIKRIDFVNLNYDDKESIFSLSEVLKFNNSTIPYYNNTFLTAIRILEDDFYQNFYIKEHEGYNHIPPMWADYKIPSATENYENIYHMQTNKSLSINGSFYKGMNNPIKNYSWYGYCYILLIIHDYNQIMNYKIIFENNRQSTEDPRLYYIGDEIYMYTITLKNNYDCLATLSALGKSECKNCVIVEEIKLDDLCSKKECIKKNTYNILCEKSHKNIRKKDDGCLLFEKNYMPFSHKGNRYMFYMSTPFKLYILNPENPKLCNQLNNIVSTDINFFKLLFDLLNNNHDVIKLSQTGPAIQYNSTDDTLYMTPMHVRISRDGYKKYLNGNKNSHWINTNIIPFMNIINNMYDKGEIILHNDIYLNFLLEFKFQIINEKIHLKIISFSNPFIFIYYNQKFMLQFGSSISLYKDKLIFSFGEGDVLCRDVIMDLNTVKNSILIHKKLYFNHLNFKPIFIRPKNDSYMYNSLASSKTNMKDIIYNTLKYNTIKGDFKNEYQYIKKLENFYSKYPQYSYDLVSPLKNHFIKFYNKGGGNCLFYSLSTGLENDSSDEKASQIRKQIYNYQYNPAEDINPISQDIIDYMKLGSIEEEKISKMTMENNNVWGTEYEIFKASKLFNIPIIIYQNSPNNIFKNSCFNHKKIFDPTTYSDFPGLIPYFSEPLFSILNNYLICVYLPNIPTSISPLILYSTNNNHYELLQPIT